MKQLNAKFWKDENNIVRLRELAKNLKCTSCGSFLDMEKYLDIQIGGKNVFPNFFILFLLS